jgi:hypothetical protein
MAQVDTPVVPFFLGPGKQKKWSHNPGPEVPTYTLPNGEVAEVVAGIQFVWSAAANDFVLATVPTLKTATISASGAGVAVVAAVATKRIKVYSIVFSVSADGTTVQFLDAAAAFGGAAAYAKYGGYSRTVDPPNFLLGTTAGNALNVTVSGGTATGEVAYWADDVT